MIVKRRAVMLALLTAVGACTMAGGSMARAAATSPVSCSYSGTASETPPGSTGPFSFAFSGTVSNCQSPAAGPGPSALAGPSGSVDNCVHGSAIAGATLTWNDGESSAISFTFRVVDGNLIGSGTVTSGLDQGDSVAMPGLAAPCSVAGGGTSQGSSSSAFLITPPA